MRLLVSVADAADAAAALAGGADIIDAKDPSRGPLGPVTPVALSAIIATVAGRRSISAALGDGDHTYAVPSALAFVKCTAPIRGSSRLVLATYADAPGWDAAIGRALDCGACGVLLDTANKQGPGLFDALEERVVGEWIARAHAVGLMAAIAGKLTAEDLPRAAALGADVVGVRGAACDGGRGGRVSAAKVQALAATAQRETGPTPVSL
jgi:(5-formylfuran-3-yl)methyl phosphate synthase